MNEPVFYSEPRQSNRDKIKELNQEIETQKEIIAALEYEIQVLQAKVREYEPDYHFSFTPEIEDDFPYEEDFE